jgi:hypothetical protein
MTICVQNATHRRLTLSATLGQYLLVEVALV